MDRCMYHHIPRNDLKGINISEKNFTEGILENWIEGAIKLDGEKSYCILPDSEIKKSYSFVYNGRFKYKGVERGKEVIYPGERRKTVDMDTNNFIIEVVLKTLKSQGTVVEKMDKSGYSLYISEGKICMMLLSKNKRFLKWSDRKINDNQWHHILVEVNRKDNPKGINIFIDGKMEKGRSEGVFLDDGESLSNKGDFLVGRGKDGNYFKGLIDFLRVSRGNLKDAKTTIEEIYEWEFNGPFLKDFFGNKIY